MHEKRELAVARLRVNLVDALEIVEAAEETKPFSITMSVESWRFVAESLGWIAVEKQDPSQPAGDSNPA